MEVRIITHCGFFFYIFSEDNDENIPNLQNITPKVCVIQPLLQNTEFLIQDVMHQVVLTPHLTRCLHCPGQSWSHLKCDTSINHAPEQKCIARLSSPYHPYCVQLSNARVNQYSQSGELRNSLPASGFFFLQHERI